MEPLQGHTLVLWAGSLAPSSCLIPLLLAWQSASNSDTVEHRKLRDQDIVCVSCVGCGNPRGAPSHKWKLLVPGSRTMNLRVCVIWLTAVLSWPLSPPPCQLALLQAQDKVSPFSVQFSTSRHENSKTLCSIPRNSAPVCDVFL